MRMRIWDRIGSVSWAAYLALLVAAYAVLPKPMVGDTTNVSAIIAYFGEHQGLIRVYAALGGLGNLCLLIFVEDLSQPRARVRLADLIRQGGERPLNISRRPGQRIRIDLVDPALDVPQNLGSGWAHLLPNSSNADLDSILQGV